MMIKYRLKLIRYVTLEGSHKKGVVDMRTEGARKILISIGQDHRLNIYDLEEKKQAGRLKIKNANLSSLCLNEDLKRVYVST
jgi:hypothetical protein